MYKMPDTLQMRGLTTQNLLAQLQLENAGGITLYITATIMTEFSFYQCRNLVKQHQSWNKVLLLHLR